MIKKSEEYKQLISELNCYQTSHERREIIGKRLSQIGDTRKGVGLNSDGFPDIEWKKVCCDRQGTHLNLLG